MRRRWAAAAVAFAVLITAWVGWDRYARLRPPVSAVVTAASQQPVAGVLFRLSGVRLLDRIEFSDHEPLTAPEGAVWVRLEVELQLDDPDAPMDALRCTGFLVAGGNEWSDDFDPSTYSGDIAQRQCHTVGDGRPLAVGEPKQLVMHWLVPRWAAAAPRFYLRFSTPPRSIELRA